MKDKWLYRNNWGKLGPLGHEIYHGCIERKSEMVIACADKRECFI